MKQERYSKFTCLVACLIVAIVSFEGVPSAQAVDLLVVSSGTNQVLRYDGQTGAFIDAFVPAGSGGLVFPEGLVFGPDGNLYVNSSGSSQVLRYNGQTGAFIDVFVPSGVINFVFGPDGKWQYSRKSGKPL